MNSSDAMMTRGCACRVRTHLILAAAGLVLSIGVVHALAQQPARGGQPALGGGRALDANSRVGGDGTNARGQDVDAIIRFNNAVVTGQAGGGKSFRGPINYRAVNEFSGSTAGDSTYRFNRDSSLSGLSGTGIRSSSLLDYQIAASIGRPTGGIDPRLSLALAPSRDGRVATGEILRTARSISEFQASEARRPTVLGVQQIGDTANRSITTASRLTGIRQQRLDDATADRLGLYAPSSSPRLRGDDPRFSRPASEPTPAPPGIPGTPGNPISDRIGPSGATNERTPSTGAPGGGDPIRTGYDAALARLKTAAEQGGLNAQTEALRAAREPRVARDARLTRSAEISGTGTASTRPLSPADPRSDEAWKRELDKLRARLSAERAEGARASEPAFSGGPRMREDLAGLNRRATGAPGTGPASVTSSGATGIPSISTRPLTGGNTPPGVQGPAGEAGMPAPSTDVRSFSARTPWDVYYEQVLLRALRESGRAERVTTMVPTGAASQTGAYAALMRRGEESIRAERSFDAEAYFSQAMNARAAGEGDVLARAGRVHAQLGAGLYLSASTALRVLVTDHPEMLGVRYDPQIIMTSGKFQKVTSELRTEMGKGMTAMGDNAALLLAYLGYQLDDVAMINEGIGRLERRRPELDISMVEMLDATRAVWSDKPLPMPRAPLIEDSPMPSPAPAKAPASGTTPQK